jgi:hypothetical protein
MSQDKPTSNGINGNGIPKSITTLLDIRKQGGAVSVLSVFIATVLLFLRLPEDQVERLETHWWIIIIPSLFVAASWMFSSYMQEMKNRTKVEEEIQKNLAKLTADFERLFAKHSTDLIYFDRCFEEIKDHLKNIYLAMEKRTGYIPGEDTERFMRGE